MTQIGPHSPMPAEPVAAGTRPGHPGASGRTAWIDHARGIAIILVVYGHCYRGLRAGGFVPPAGPLSTIDGIIYGFHMPLFFFLAGVFGVRSAMLPERAFWLGRLRTIVWPYVLWMTCELLLLAFFAGSTNMGRIEIGPSIYLFAPISPFWFLYALLFCAWFVHLLLPLGRWWMMSLAVAGFIGGQFAPVEIVQLTTWGILYYACGAISTQRVRNPAFGARLAAPGVILLTAAGAVLCGLSMIRLGVPYRAMAPVAVLGSVAVFGLAARLQRLATAVPGLSVIGYLGRISLTVLVVHVIATAATRIILSRLLGVHDGGVHLIAGTLMGLAVPIALQLGCDWLRIGGALGLPNGAAASPAMTPPPGPPQPAAQREEPRPRSSTSIG